MIEVTGNLWDYPADLRVISTNGFVKKDGSCVMGRGCALEATQRFPTLSKALGAKITEAGNRVYLFPTIYLATFPVKRVQEYCAPNKFNVVEHMRNKFMPGDKVPGWACIASLELIERSAWQLVRLMNDNPKYRTAVLPRVGAGAGELDWEQDVKPLLAPILDDRFHIITFK